MSSKAIHVISSNHMDPIWVRRWQGEIRFRDDWYRSYADIEETQIRSWMSVIAEGPGAYSIEQAISVRSFLERNPDAIDRFRRYLQEGRLEIWGCGETTIDYNLVGGESIVRNHLYSIRWCERNLGARPVNAAAPDTFGLSAQVPQILRKLGYERLLPIINRGFHGPGCFWRGLDGSIVNLPSMIPEALGEKALLYLWGGWACSTVSRCCHGEACPICGYSGIDVSGHLPWEGDLERFGRLLRERNPPNVITYWQTEEGVPDPRFPEKLAALAAELGYEVHFSTMARIFDAFDGGSVQRLRSGSIAESEIKPSVEANPVFPGCYVTRISLKQWNRELEGLLRCAETVSAFAHDHGMTYPRKRIASLWSRMALLQFHDAVTGTQTDPAYDELCSLVREVRRAAGGIAVEAAQAIERAATVPPRPGCLPFLLFNPLPWAVWRQCVPAHLPVTDQDSITGVAVTDAQGRSVPVLGFEIVRNNVGLDFSDTMFRAAGNVRPPRKLADAVVNARGAHVRLTLAGVDLPPCGYATFHARLLRERPQAAEEAMGIAGRDAIENEFHVVRCDAKEVLEIWDKEAGRPMLVDLVAALHFEEDIGSQWHTAAPPTIVFDLRSQAVITASKMVSADAQRLVFAGEYAPNALERGMSGLKTLRWRQEFTLLRGARGIRIRTEVDWDAEDSRLKLLFGLPFQPPQDRAAYEIPYGVLEREPCAPRHGEFGSSRNGDWPALNFVSCRDPESGYVVALLNRGLPCHKVEHGIIHATVLRSPTFRSDLDPVGKRDRGLHVFEHELRSFQGGNIAHELVRRGMELNTPVVCTPATAKDGILGSTHSFFANAAGSVVVTAVKRAEDDDALVVRAFEADGAPAVDSFAGVAARALVETDLLERELHAAQEMRYRPYEIKTFRLAPAGRGGDR